MRRIIQMIFVLCLVLPAFSQQNGQVQITSLNQQAADSALINLKGYPVIGASNDTLYYVYNRIGAFSAKERADAVSKKIQLLLSNDLLQLDSLELAPDEDSWVVNYKDLIVMSVTQADARSAGMELNAMAKYQFTLLKDSLKKAREHHEWLTLLLRIFLVILVLVIAYTIFRLIKKGHQLLLNLIESKRDLWLRNLSYKDYTFLSQEQELSIILFLVKLLRWIIYAILLYITLPILFSIFPFSRDWADALFQLIWLPFKKLLLAVWNYLPNLFSILVVALVLRYVNRFVRYIFNEIESGSLNIPGFHSEWSMTTYSIVRFMLMVFGFIVIFQYLPGSSSGIFQGVSVFLGVLVSFGSSSVTTNIMAGLVLTYMRPFKVGDRIKIGEVSGEVVEKTLLVTRLLTIKNEIVTIPNSTVLSGNTINYSSETEVKGLIIYSSVTIGYDVPWRDMHSALIEAASRTELILKEPAPFVLQTSLDDFYVSYQINAYVKDAGKQALIYSEMHQNIQDVCVERGIEIMSPHYRAERDGSKPAIPTKMNPKV